MTAAVYDLNIEQGVDFTKSLVIKDNLNQPLNLTGYICKMHIRKYQFSTTTLLEADTVNGKIAIDPLVGVVLINLPAAVTELFDTKKAVYDIKLISPTGKVTMILAGDVNIDLTVTRIGA